MSKLAKKGSTRNRRFPGHWRSDPDLVQRFAENAPLAEVDWETVYASGPHGYSDYPTYQLSQFTRS